MEHILFESTFYYLRLHLVTGNHVKSSSMGYLRLPEATQVSLQLMAEPILLENHQGADQIT